MKYPPHSHNSSILSDDTDSSGQHLTIREDLADSNIVFIHSKLDDARLTPKAFRVYCHIARRGECFSKAENVAKICCMNRDTVWKALKELEKRNMIQRESRKFRTTILKLTKPSDWKAAESRGRLRGGNEGPLTRRKRGATKVIPVQGDPLKGDPQENSRSLIQEFLKESDRVANLKKFKP